MIVYTWQKFESWLLLLLSLYILQDIWGTFDAQCIYLALCDWGSVLYRAACHKIAALVFLTERGESLTCWFLVIFSFLFTQRYVSDEICSRCPLVETRASSRKIAPIVDSERQRPC